MATKEGVGVEKPKFTISQAIPQIGLSSREKFVCLRVFNPAEEHTLDEWNKLLIAKKIK